MSDDSYSTNVGGSRNSTRKLIVVVALSLLGFVLVWSLIRSAGGNSVEDINAEYGQRFGTYSRDSVNGTAVLAEMFERRDFEVSTWRKLSPRLEKADTIVWFPDDMEVPSLEQRKWLEQWLGQGNNRTLIYVGRDFDAEVTYWEKVLPQASEAEQKKIKSRLADAKDRHATLRKQLQADEDANWFVVRDGGNRRTATSLEGPWASDIDAAKTWIEVHGFLDAPQHDDLESEVLLSSQGDPLVVRLSDLYSYEWGTGKIIVVSNASFLVNLSLVNREHRKLASRLIDECAGEKVVFLESGASRALRIDDTDYNSKRQAWYTTLTVFPINAVILHIATAGIVFCFAMFPIFGRPHTAPSDSDSDFGKHIDALGKLLAKTRDSGYARARLAYYEEKIRRESGASHSE